MKGQGVNRNRNMHDDVSDTEHKETLGSPSQPSANKKNRTSNHAPFIDAPTGNTQLAAGRKLARLLHEPEGGAPVVVLSSSQVLPPTHPLAGLVAWAQVTHETAKPLASKTKLTQCAKSIYSKSIPSERPVMPQQQQENCINALEEIGRRSNGDLYVYPQGREDDVLPTERSSPATYFEKHPKDATHCLYHVMPRDESQRSCAEGDDERLTLVVNLDNPANMLATIRAIGSLVQEDPRVRQAKIMGPSRVRERSDHGVLYVRGNKEDARQVADKLLEKLGSNPEVLDDIVLPGQERFARGVFFSQTAEGGSTSYRASRAEIIGEAVAAYRSEQGELVDHVMRAAANHQFDPNLPSQLQQNTQDDMSD